MRLPHRHGETAPAGESPPPEDPFALIAPHYDALMANVPYAMWADYVAELARLAGRPIRPGSRVLDLATGTGSVALEFAARRCTVVGVDISPAMLEQARAKAARRGLEVTFLCQNVAELSVPGKFDHAVCLYDSLNYLLEYDALKQTFARVAKALEPHGLFIFDVNTVRALEAELFTQRSAPDAAVAYRWVSRYDPWSRTSRIKMFFRIRDTGETFTVVHQQRAYTDEEIREALALAGFTRITAYEAYCLTPPTPLTDRAYYVAALA